MLEACLLRAIPAARKVHHQLGEQLTINTFDNSKLLELLVVLLVEITWQN